MTSMHTIWLAISGVAAFVVTGCIGPGPLPPVATPPPRPPNWVLQLQSDVERLTGPDAVDCGQHMLRQMRGADEETLRRSISCGLAAVQAGKPFWTFKQNLSEDSFFVQGLAGTPDGVVYRFSYDSMSAPRITFEPCPKPIAGTNADHRTEFQCLR